VVGESYVFSGYVCSLSIFPFLKDPLAAAAGCRSREPGLSHLKVITGQAQEVTHL